MILSEKKTSSLPLFLYAPPCNKRHKHQLFPSKVAHFEERGVTLHKQVFETVAGHMPHLAHIRVRYAGDIQQPVPVYFPVRQMAVHLRHALADARFYLSRQIAAVGLHENAEKSASFIYLLQKHLVGMQRQLQFLFQKAAQLRDELRQTFPVSVHDKEIIHIAPVIPLAQSTLHKLVEHV